MSEQRSGMPVFAVKAKDNLATHAICAYYAACICNGLHEQAKQVEAALTEIMDWREANKALCKWPDHKHAPAGTPGSGSEATPTPPHVSEQPRKLLDPIGYVERSNLLVCQCNGCGSQVRVIDENYKRGDYDYVLVANHAPPQPGAPKRTGRLHGRPLDDNGAIEFSPQPGERWTDEELTVIAQLAFWQELSTHQVFRQALRLYQLHVERTKAGETCVWSGDAQRAREFAGEPQPGETGTWREHPCDANVPPDECSTSEMLRRVANHITVPNEFDKQQWIDALRKRADEIEPKFIKPTEADKEKAITWAESEEGKELLEDAKRMGETGGEQSPLQWLNDWLWKTDTRDTYDGPIIPEMKRLMVRMLYAYRATPDAALRAECERLQRGLELARQSGENALRLLAEREAEIARLAEELDTANAAATSEAIFADEGNATIAQLQQRLAEAEALCRKYLSAEFDIDAHDLADSILKLSNTPPTEAKPSLPEPKAGGTHGKA